MSNIGDTAFYKRDGQYMVMPVTGNDSGLLSSGFSDLGGLQGYMNSLNNDLEYYKSIQPLVNGQIMSLKRPDGTNYGESHYTGPDPSTQIKYLEDKLAEANAGQGMFAPNYNNGAQVINGNYTEKGAIDAEAAHQAAVKAGTEKIAQTINGVNFYQPTNAAPFVQGSTPGSNPGMSTSFGLTPVDPSKVPNAPPGYSNASLNMGSGASMAGLPTSNLQPGMQGAEVKQLQDYLVSKGLMTPAEVATGPGIYGPKTQAAVAKLQQGLGMTVPAGQEGYFGPLTRTALSTAGSQTGSQTGNQTGDSSQNGSLDFPTTGDSKLDAIFGSLKDYVTNTLASGYQVNGALQITPELVSKFLADAHTQIDPKYQQVLSNEINNINASLKNLGTQYQNQRDQTVQDFQTGLASSREEAAGNGVAFSGLRGMNEQNTVNSTNRNLGNLDATFSKNIGDTLRTGAGQVGQGAPGLSGSSGDFGTPQLNGATVNLEGARGGASLGGALDYGYNSGNYKYGQIPGNYASDLVDQSNQFLSSYQKAGANNGRTFQNLNGTPTLY